MHDVSINTRIIHWEEREAENGGEREREREGWERGRERERERERERRKRKGEKSTNFRQIIKWPLTTAEQTYTSICCQFTTKPHQATSTIHETPPAFETWKISLTNSTRTYIFVWKCSLTERSIVPRSKRRMHKQEHTVTKISSSIESATHKKLIRLFHKRTMLSSMCTTPLLRTDWPMSWQSEQLAESNGYIHGIMKCQRCTAARGWLHTPDTRLNILTTRE